MNISKIQNEFNKLSLAPNFNRAELHHIIAYDNGSFIFVDWDYTAKTNEKKFFCLLVDKEFNIPGFNHVWDKSYELREKNIYQPISNSSHLILAINKQGTQKLRKYSREFSIDAVQQIRDELKSKYSDLKSYFSLCMQGQIYVIEVAGIFISITFSMVYISKDKDVFSQIVTL